MTTPKQKLFIDHYKTTKNATESAKKAGYSAKTAYVIGSRLLKNPSIKVELDRALAEERGKIPKESYIALTMEEYQTAEQKGERIKALDLAGRALGYIGSGGNRESSSQITNNTQINIEINGDPAKLWEAARGLLG